jgi:hypothetical protein
VLPIQPRQDKRARLQKEHSGLSQTVEREEPEVVCSDYTDEEYQDDLTDRGLFTTKEQMTTPDGERFKTEVDETPHGPRTSTAPQQSKRDYKKRVAHPQASYVEKVVVSQEKELRMKTRWFYLLHFNTTEIDTVIAEHLPNHTREDWEYTHCRLHAKGMCRGWKSESLRRMKVCLCNLRVYIFLVTHQLI